jgi:hypothetical protein
VNIRSEKGWWTLQTFNSMTKLGKWFNRMFQLALKPCTLLKWSNGKCQIIGDRKQGQSFSSQRLMTWQGPTTETKPPPMQMWLTCSRVSPMTGSLQHWRSSIGKEINSSGQISNQGINGNLQRNRTTN